MMLKVPATALRALGVAAMLASPTGTFADMPTFSTEIVEMADGTRLHLRVGGEGPAVVLLHGYTQTGDMWTPVAEALRADHKVIVPDLIGIGGSVPTTDESYSKAAQARDLAEALDVIGVGEVAVVGHDIGSMIAYGFAAEFPERTCRLVLMEAPLPGIGPWDQIRANPRAWHMNFHGAVAEALTEGRERVWLDKFWDGFAADPYAIDEKQREHYTQAYARPGAMRAGFSQFAAMERDAEDNAGFAVRTLAMPILAVGVRRGRAN